ncbi:MULTISPECIES: DnaJ C-terminal domain-containing protein [unclassified Roseitalea]|uniref:DnaJ C-terminal domain-containing protein n=1 Tax=unclassified Roseitalea TaxID=2639107 RepID=UPI00273E365A|nr:MULTISPECIES: DnaJ C-terminal domain-containing protein [unclassified Roseitalea]
MPDDPYSVLGVARDASDADIRKAYRELAKKLHPDLHPGDTAAEERFKAVSAAYHLLGDPERRARFDRGEIDASGAERSEQGFYRSYADTDGGGRYYTASGFEDLSDVSDIFAEMFGRRGRGGGRVDLRGQDVRYRLDVDFLDAVNGARRRITLPDGKDLDLTIPSGVDTGQVLRLRGKGAPGIGNAPAGDALVEIGVRPHSLFRRDGKDIILDLPITIDEAILGAKVEVPTIAGRVKMTVPKGASTGDVLRLRGRGLKDRNGRAGDQKVILRIEAPQQIDQELEDFMRSWRERHRYDPRAGMRAQS